MPKLYVVKDIHETLRGLFGTVALPDGRLWVLGGRTVTEAPHDATATERRMTIADVDLLLDLEMIDIECARRQVVRVLP